jgi:hypothetical protein
MLTVYDVVVHLKNTVPTQCPSHLIRGINTSFKTTKQTLAMEPLHSVAQKRGMDPFGRSPCMRKRGPTDLIQRNIPSDAVRSRSDCVVVLLS